jgi:hypothetical protein
MDWDQIGEEAIGTAASCSTPDFPTTHLEDLLRQHWESYLGLSLYRYQYVCDI